MEYQETAARARQPTWVTQFELSYPWLLLEFWFFLAEVADSFDARVENPAERCHLTRASFRLRGTVLVVSSKVVLGL